MSRRERNRIVAYGEAQPDQIAPHPSNIKAHPQQALVSGGELEATTGRDVEREDRGIRALGLRRAGASHGEIAHALSYASTAQVATAIQAAERRELAAEAREHQRALATMRLDKALRALWARVEQGDDFAIRTLVQVEARRARLWGLDEPERIEVDRLPVIDLEVHGMEVRRIDGGDPGATHPPTGVNADPPAGGAVARA